MDNGNPYSQDSLLLRYMPTPNIKTNGYIAILSYQQYVQGTNPEISE